MSVEHRVRDHLSRRAASIDPAVNWDDLEARMRRGRRRRQALAGACALVILAGATATAIAVWPRDASRSEVRTEDRADGPVTQPRSDPTGEPDETLSPHDADVDDLPAPPLEPRTVPVMAWAGREVVVWGGFFDGQSMGQPAPSVHYDDGAAYDPASRTWRTMSESPLPGGLEPSEWPPPPRGVWTGSELLIFQGGKAAAWDPETDAWRDAADPPANVDTAGAAMTVDGILGLVATGDEVIQLRPRSASAWDPVGNQWSPLPDPPIEIWEGAAVWTGDELVVLGTTSPSGYSGFPQSTEGVAYDPETERWRTLPSTDLVRTAAAAWTGREVLVLDFDNTRAAAAYDPAGDEWHELPELPLPAQEGISSIHMVDGTPVVWSFPGAAVLIDGEWYPLSTGDGFGGSVAGAGVLWSIERDGTASSPAMSLSGFRPPASVEELAGAVIQVGFGRLRLPDGFTLEHVEASEEAFELDPATPAVSTRVAASLAGAHGPCEVTSRPGQPGDGETIEIDPVEGEASTAVHIEPGRIDMAEAGVSQHVLEINCEAPADADVLARHIVPAAGPG